MVRDVNTPTLEIGCGLSTDVFAETAAAYDISLRLEVADSGQYQDLLHRCPPCQASEAQAWLFRFDKYSFGRAGSLF